MTPRGSTNQYLVKDEEGKRYGSLVVRCHLGPQRGKNPGALWLCDCDCGSEREVLGTDLRTNRVYECRSCSKRRKHRFIDAMEEAGPPPCDQGCSMYLRCRDFELACKVFLHWIKQTNKPGTLKNSPPDPARYMPNRAMFRMIYGDD